MFKLTHYRLVDYLAIKLWFEYNTSTMIENNPQESSNTLNLQFFDYISNIVWNRFENNESVAYNILKKKIKSIPSSDSFPPSHLNLIFCCIFGKLRSSHLGGD